MNELWRVESRDLKFRKYMDSRIFSILVGMMEDIRTTENERVYLKLNSLEPSNEYCRFGIVSNIPLYSCIRSSVLHRKLISIHFSDQYVSTSHQLLSPASFLTIPYAKDYIKPGKDLKNVLGIILYEPLITLVSRGDEEDKILRMCI